MTFRLVGLSRGTVAVHPHVEHMTSKWLKPSDRVHEVVSRSANLSAVTVQRDASDTQKKYHLVSDAYLIALSTNQYYSAIPDIQ